MDNGYLDIMKYAIIKRGMIYPHCLSESELIYTRQYSVIVSINNKIEQIRHITVSHISHITNNSSN